MYTHTQAHELKTKHMMVSQLVIILNAIRINSEEICCKGFTVTVLSSLQTIIEFTKTTYQ